MSVDGRFNEQGNLHMRLTLEDRRWVDPHLPTTVLSLYESLNWFGHVFSPKALDNISFSRDCPWSSSHCGKWCTEHIIQGQGKRWGAFSCCGFDNLVWLMFPHNYTQVIYFDGDTTEIILTKWSNENHQSWDKFTSCFSSYNEWRTMMQNFKS